MSWIISINLHDLKIVNLNNDNLTADMLLVSYFATQAKLVN